MVNKLHNIYDGWDEMSIGRLWKNFLDNELMAVDTFSYALPFVTSNKKFKVLAQTTSMKRFDCSITRVQMLGIVKNCRNIEAAVDFIRFACGRKGQFILAQSGCNIPALRHCAESDVFLKGCPENMSENLKELEYENSFLDLPIYNDSKFYEINDISADYYSGKITLEQAVDALKSFSSRTGHQ